MKKIVSILFLLIIGFQTAKSQNLGSLKTTVEEPIVDENKSYATIGLLVGSSGIGIEAKKRYNEDAVLRFGFNILPINFTKYEELGNVTVKGYYKSNFTNIHLLADYTVLKNNNFEVKAVSGLAYFAKAEVEVNVTPVGNYYYGEIQLNDGTMGDATIKADWSGLAPYLGVGLGASIPETKMNISLDLGTYYFLSNAKVDMKTTGYLIGNENQRKQIQDNLKPYKWLPTLQISINYKL